MQTGEDIRLLNEKIQHASLFTETIRNALSKVIIGQHEMINRLLIALLSNGHILLEGVPGLAKH
jgi:MoxR-like ATPase